MIATSDIPKTVEYDQIILYPQVPELDLVHKVELYENLHAFWYVISC